MPSTWLEEEQNHCWLRTRGQQKKKHSVGLPTTLLKKKIANNFTPIRPTIRINAWFAGVKLPTVLTVYRGDCPVLSCTSMIGGTKKED